MGTRRDLRDAHARICTDRFNLAVLGEFKRGKSTLINALLDRELLPTASCRSPPWSPRSPPALSTASSSITPTVARWSVPSPSSRSSSPKRATPTIVSASSSRAWSLTMSSCVPGSSSSTPRASARSTATTPMSLVGSATRRRRSVRARRRQPLSDAERQDAQRRGTADPSPDDHRQQDRSSRSGRSWRRAGVRSLNSRRPTRLRRRRAVWRSARHHEGLAPLRARLLELASGERESLLLRSVAGVGHNVALSGAQAARFEARAIQLPLDELASRARQFDQRIAELRAAGAEAGDLLSGGSVARLLRWSTSPCRRTLADRRPRYAARFVNGPPSFNALPSRAGQRAPIMDRRTVHPRRHRSGLSPPSPTRSLSLRSATRHACATSSRRFTPPHRTCSASARMRCCPRRVWRAPSRFSFKLHDVETRST